MRPELQDVVDEVSRLMATPATLEDRDFTLVAFYAHGQEIDEVRQSSILHRRSTAEVKAWFEQFGIATSEVPVRTPSDAGQGVLSRLCLPARWHGVTYGYLWLLDERHEIDEERIPAAMALAARAGVLMAQQYRARVDQGFRLRDLLATDAEAAEQAAADVDAQGIIARGVPVTAIELRPAEPTPVTLWNLPRAVLADTDEDHTTLLVAGPAIETARHARSLYAERLDERGRAGLAVGIGTPAPDLAQARATWLQARLAARVCAAVPAMRPIASWPTLGVYRLLACGPSRSLREGVLDPAIRRLLATGDTDLIDTARSYLDNAGNVARTAADCLVHRQTVYYRLRRIASVTGLDLDDGRDRLTLHLGLTLAPLT